MCFRRSKFRYQYSSSFSSFRHVTIRPRGSARAQRSMDSLAEGKEFMSPTGWLRPSIPPPTQLDHLYLSVSQAALRSEVKDACLFKWQVSFIVCNIGERPSGFVICIQFSSLLIGLHCSLCLLWHTQINNLNHLKVGCSGCNKTKLLSFSHRCVCVSGHAVPPPPAAWLPRPQSLHLPARSVPLLSSRCCLIARDCL